MVGNPGTDTIIREIEEVLKSGCSDPASAIEESLEKALGDLPVEERIALLEETALQLETSPVPGDSIAGLPRKESDKLVSLLIGKNVATSGLSSEEISAKLAASLNTIFDTLNQTIRVINIALLGQTGEMETIRGIIGSAITGKGTEISLQSYLNQIREAFLVAHKAFRLATEVVVGQVLSELDPRKMSALAEGKMKFGPLRKAELFEIYENKFQSCKGSFESGHLMEEFLREFERTCRKLYKSETRRDS